MTKKDELRIDQQQLTNAWQRTLPEWIEESDKCEVLADESDPHALRITIQNAGRQAYSLDFKVQYVDSREVKVQLIDVEKDQVSVDERTEVIQQLIQDYTRHLHECAQALHQLTHA
ncbi:hypothetical protein [Paenibacillus sp. NEAU-GSW1]|uniref:hypothetical protein n=1 Tax=Paenibacillus sp. NEAU-GSW1 TaxID=2682486 RepID=UPI0012E16DD6|nr:hypothetical protein [Paenibacillus sp. NEAU-GSW1]MUT67946.1 hypothetical protein [Paenibacillus sp. NEAU-GSW1]